MPTYRIVIGTANYCHAQTPEEAADKIMPGFLRSLPDELRGAGTWKVLSVEEAEDDFLSPERLRSEQSVQPSQGTDR